MMGRTISALMPIFDGVGSSDDMEAPMLTLEQLLPDARGAVVLMNDSHLRYMMVEATSSVVGKGVAGAERTLAGDDVTGFHWFRFANGVTLYYPPDVVLTLKVPPT